MPIANASAKKHPSKAPSRAAAARGTIHISAMPINGDNSKAVSRGKSAMAKARPERLGSGVGKIEPGFGIETGDQQDRQG